MPSADQGLELAGVVLTGVDLPGFGIPVFVDSAGVRYTSISDGRERIAGFAPVHLRDDAMITSTAPYHFKSGELLPYGFIFRDRVPLVGSAPYLRRVLGERYDELASIPFLRIDVARFLDNAALLHEAVGDGFAELARHNLDVAVRWRRRTLGGDRRQNLGLAWYLLRRFLGGGVEKVTLEPTDDEADLVASIEYTAPGRLREIVQCRVLASDRRLDFRDLRIAFDRIVDGDTIAHALAADNCYFTLLLVGSASRPVSRKLGIPELRGYPPSRLGLLDLNDVFPPDLRLTGVTTPRWDAVLGTQELTRVRLLGLPEIDLLHLLARTVLAERTTLPPETATAALHALIDDLDVFPLVKPASRRALSFERLSDRSTTESRWVSGATWLGRETGEEGHSDPAPDAPLSWKDFAANLYVQRPEYEEAWSLLAGKGRLTVSGPLGTGKSTMCRFLAFRHMATFPTQPVYVLNTPARQELGREAEWLKAQSGPALIIIEDEHLASDAVDLLLQSLSTTGQDDRRRVIVTSTHSYSPSQAMAGRRRYSPLFGYALVSLDRLDETAFHDFLTQLRWVKTNLGGALSDRQLHGITGGTLGHALIIARLASRLDRNAIALDMQRNLALALRDWVLRGIGRPNDIDYFDQECAPIFIVGAAGAPIAPSFGPGVSEMNTVGLLHVVDQHDARSFFADRTLMFGSLELPRQLLPIYRTNIGTLLTSYYRRDRDRLAAICASINHVTDPALLNGFREFVTECLPEVTEDVSSTSNALSLGKVANIVSAVRRSRRESGRQLIESMTRYAQRTDGEFWERYFSPDRAYDVRDATRFCWALSKGNRWAVREVGRLVDGESELARRTHSVLKNICGLASASLDQLGSYLAGLGTISAPLARRLHNELREDGVVQLKAMRLDSGIPELTSWLRFCWAMRTIDRVASRAYLMQEITADKIVAVAHEQEDLPALRAIVLSAADQLPRAAAQAVQRIVEAPEGNLYDALRRETQIGQLANLLYAFSRAHRRSGVRVADHIVDHVKGLLSLSDTYRQVGSALATLKRAVSSRYAERVSEAVNVDALVRQLRAEDRYIHLVGRLLATVAEVAPRLGEELVEHIDYGLYIGSSGTVGVARLALFLRGFVLASPAAERGALVERMTNDVVLRSTFTADWQKTSLEEVAFAVDRLSDAALTQSQVWQLMGFASRRHLAESILKLFESRPRTAAVATGLQVCGRFDYRLGQAALDRVVARYVARPVRQGSTANGGASASQDEDLRYTSIGALLQAAYSIDPTKVVKLADGLLARHQHLREPHNDANLGHLAHYLAGLRISSRKHALAVGVAITKANRLAALLAYNDEPANVLFLGQMLARIGRRFGSSYAQQVCTDWAEDMFDFVGAQGNLSLATQWLSLVRQSDGEHTLRAVELITDIEGDDGDLFHRCDATVALLDADRPELARKMASRVVESIGQMRNVIDLMTVIPLLLRAQRIEASVGIELVEPLLASVVGLDRMVAAAPPAAAAVAVRFFHERGRFDLVHRLYDGVLDPTLTTNIVQLAIAYALLAPTKGARQQFLGDLARHSDWQDRMAASPRFAWSRGLAVLASWTAAPEADNPFTSGPWNTGWLEAVVRDALDTHTPNAEFALVRLLVGVLDPGRLETQEIEQQTMERAKDEINQGVVVLLRSRAGQSVTVPTTVLWSLLRETALASTFVGATDRVADDDQEEGIAFAAPDYLPAVGFG